MQGYSVYEALVFFLILLASLSVHEWAHAWTAEKLGDSTARLMGRVTFNPVPHIDPVGTIIVPAFFLLASGGGAFFAWAKPVPVNPRNFRKPVRDDILVAMAGPASNLVICLLVAVLVGLAFRLGNPAAFLDLASDVIFINAMLMVFNLIPVPPLDGSHVLRHVVGMGETAFLRFSQFGFMILLALLFLTPFPRVLLAGILAVQGLAVSVMRTVGGG
ncbi:MAG: site-2 protease family protein [Puniceicoccaceae bacterium]